MMVTAQSADVFCKLASWQVQQACFSFFGVLELNVGIVSAACSVLHYFNCMRSLGSVLFTSLHGQTIAQL